MNGFVTIDLSRLPPPEVVETLLFETIVQEMRDDLVARFPAIVNVIDLESEPARKLLECFAYRELLLRARINDAARSVLLAFARGGDLDHIGANYGVERLVVVPATETTEAVYEDDERFRRRIQLALEAYSVAGPAGAYVYFTLTAEPTLHDATAISPEPGKVVVTAMASGDDPVPTDRQIDIVRDALSAETVRPLTDNVIVTKAVPIEVTVEAELTLYPGPDGAVVVQEAQAAVAALLAQNRRLGYDLRRSALFSRLHVEGVYSVNLISPASDVIAGPGEVIIAIGTTVSVVGRDT